MGFFMLKIGRIPFTNLFPIYYHLTRADSGSYEFIEGVPSEVNRLLRGGRIDISPSSSIEYLRRPDQYILIPGHSISSEGPARSILLLSRMPVEELNGASVLYSYQSETSAALLRIVLSVFYGIQYGLRSSDLSLSEGLRGNAAYLLIGDDALREGLRRTNLFIYDLGEIWYRETGLPFVFALWIANRISIKDIDTFKEELDRAKEYAGENLKEIAMESPSRAWFPEEELIAYWKALSYNLGERHMRGIELFRRYLVELGILTGGRWDEGE